MTIRLAVLGSNSFAGSSFINYCLNKKINVIGFSRSKQKNNFELKYKFNKNLDRFRFYKLNINTNIDKVVNILKSKKITHLVDFAGQGMVNESWSNPEQWFKTNVYTKIKLIEEIKKLKIKRYIKISTPEVYGSREKKLLESDHHNPSTPYALTHSTIDNYLILQNQNFNFPCVILRFANFYGEHQPLYRIIPKTIYSIIYKKKLPLHGSGKSFRSFIYIDDFCDAIYKSLNKSKIIGEIFNISSNEIISIKDLIQSICKKMNYDYKKLISNSSDRIGKDKKYFMNSNKAIKILNWKNKINLSIGLDNTIKWFSKNKFEINKMEKKYIHKK